VTVLVGAEVITYESSGTGSWVGTAVKVTVWRNVGTGVVHSVAGTETKWLDGTEMVETVSGTNDGVATTTYPEFDEMVAMFDNETWLMAQVAETMTGLVHVDGTLIEAEAALLNC
jgi:hypothetical protein